MGYIFLSQLKKALTRSRNELVEYTTQIAKTLDAHNKRISDIEDNSGDNSLQTKVLSFYLDENGEVCQCLGKIDTNVYVPTGLFSIDNDGDLCFDDATI